MDFLKKLKDHFIPSERNVYRPHILRKPWLIFFVTIVLTTEGVFILDLVARQSALDFIAAVLPGEVIALTNTQRVENNAGTLTENAELTAAAQAKAEDMATKGYFAHVSPDGTEPWVWVKGAGYDYQYAGENLAVQFTDSTEVVNAWMASPTHRANIVKPQYTEIGIGIADGEFKGQRATYVVQYFGAPRSSVAAVPTAAAVAAVPPQTGSRVEGAATVAPAADEPLPATEAVSTDYTETTQSPSVEQKPQSPWSSFARELLSNQSEPSSAVLWVLGAVASLMVIGIALAFFVHIQIQPTDMLIGGTVVAVIALGFFALNTQTMFTPRSDQAAAVFGAMPTGAGFIDSSAAQTVGK